MDGRAANPGRGRRVGASVDRTSQARCLPDEPPAKSPGGHWAEPLGLLRRGLDGRWLMAGGVVNNTPVSHAVALGATTVWVLPAGYPCARDAPPSTALAMALHGITLLVEHGLAVDVQRFHDTVQLRVAPPLCPLTVSPADFSHTAELLHRGYTSTADWLTAGCPVLTGALAPHHHAASPRRAAAPVTRPAVEGARAD